MLLTAFAWWSTRSRHPLLPTRIVTDRNRGASYLGMLISAGGMFGVFLFLTYFLQTGLDYTPIDSGVAFLPMVVGLVIAATLATNVLVPRIGPRLVVPPGMAISAVGLVWMTRLDMNSSYAVHILPMTVIVGFGLGLVVATAMSLGTLGVSVHDAGVASATVNAMQQVGGSIGIALLNTVSASAATNYLSGRNPRDPAVKAQAALESYHTAFWWSAGFFAGRRPGDPVPVPAGCTQGAEGRGTHDPHVSPARALTRRAATCPPSRAGRARRARPPRAPAGRSRRSPA